MQISFSEPLALQSTFLDVCERMMSSEDVRGLLTEAQRSRELQICM